MADKTIMNPVKAIRAKCLDCCGGVLSEIALCPVKDCALYAFRAGRNPFRKKRELTDEQREQAANRLKAARALKNAA